MSDQEGFLDKELALITKDATTEVEGLEVMSASHHSVQVKIVKTDHKQLRLLIMFPEGYPGKTLLVEVKSKTLPDRVMKAIEGLAEKEAKKLQGQYQVIGVCKVVRKFLEDNMFSVCAGEIDQVKNGLIDSDKDELKLKQKSGSFIVKCHQKQYFMELKMSITDDYPRDPVLVESKSTNFPTDLAEMFIRQSIEIGRRCIMPPAIVKKGDPPFMEQPSIYPVAEYLIKKCIKFYPTAPCALCEDEAFPSNPAEVTQDIRHPKYVEYVYCSHIFHHSCLDRFMKTPPFVGGKKCPNCDKQIFHEKWKATPEVAEARWAHKQAKRRILDEVTDFMDF